MEGMLNEDSKLENEQTSKLVMTLKTCPNGKGFKENEKEKEKEKKPSFLCLSSCIVWCNGLGYICELVVKHPFFMLFICKSKAENLVFPMPLEGSSIIVLL